MGEEERGKRKRTSTKAKRRGKEARERKEYEKERSNQLTNAIEEWRSNHSKEGVFFSFVSIEILIALLMSEQ